MMFKLVYLVIVFVLVVWIVIVFVYLNLGSYVCKVLVDGWLELSYGVFKLYVDVRCGNVVDVLIYEG